MLLAAVAQVSDTADEPTFLVGFVILGFMHEELWKRTKTLIATGKLDPKTPILMFERKDD